MSSAWQAALREAWAELARHPVQSRQFRTRRLSTEFPLDVYAALRAADNASCLVLAAAARPDALFEVGGMRLGTAAGETGPLLVLSLEDHDRADLFTTVCADAIEAAAGAASADALGQFLVRLDAWRSFLRERRSGLTRQETIGLFGELIACERLVAADPQAHVCWLAPDGGLHDFVRQGHAIEVKTSLGPSSTISISSLDQLDLAGLRHLDLLHVRLVESPDGRTIHDLIGVINGHLADEASRRTFANALLRRGLMPHDETARSGPRAQLRSIEGYRVVEGFPRLSKSAVPAAIVDAVYVLDLRALSPHAVNAEATFRGFLGSFDP